MKSMRTGCPQLRLRDNRIACHVGPVSSSCTPPAKHPLEYPPKTAAGWLEAVFWRPKSVFASVVGLIPAALKVSGEAVGGGAAWAVWRDEDPVSLLEHAASAMQTQTIVEMRAMFLQRSLLG